MSLRIGDIVKRKGCISINTEYLIIKKTKNYCIIRSLEDLKKGIENDIRIKKTWITKIQRCAYCNEEAEFGYNRFCSIHCRQIVEDLVKKKIEILTDSKLIIEAKKLGVSVFGS